MNYDTDPLKDRVIAAAREALDLIRSADLQLAERVLASSLAALDREQHGDVCECGHLAKNHAVWGCSYNTCHCTEFRPKKG